MVGTMARAAGQIPDQPAVYRTKQKLAVRCATCALTRAFDVVEDPLHLGAGKIRVNDQTGVIADVLFHAIALQAFADIRGTTALPDNRVIDRFTGLSFPDDGRFTLVSNPDSCNLIGTDVRFRQDFHQSRALRCPDFHRVVFYPACFRVDLLKFAL